MTAPEIALYDDQQLPATAITWLAADGTPLALASGYTFTAELVSDTNVALATKVAGITGSNTAPNVTITWADGDLTGVAGLVRLRLSAVDGAGNRRVFRPDNLPTVLVRPAPTTPAV